MSDYITVQQLKDKIQPKLHGASLKKLSGNFYDKMREAAAKMLIRIDPPDTVYKQRIDNALYDRVYNYTCPVYIKGPTKVTDIRPIGPRAYYDDPMATSGRSFDIQKEQMKNGMTIETIAGVKTLRISNAYLPGQTMLVDLNAINSGSTLPTVTAGGDAQNLTIDYLDYITSSGSLSFGLSGSTGSGTITIVLPQVFDLTTLNNLGALFAWEKFPDASRLTSIKMRWSSDTSGASYWERTITAPQGRTAFDSNAWNLITALWTGATVVGSPNAASIQYIQFIYTYSTGVALTGVKIDSVTASLGKAYEILYYDSRIFKNASTGALQSVPILDTDLITLDENATQIFMEETRKICVQEIKGKNMAADISEIHQVLEGDPKTRYSDPTNLGMYREYNAQYASDAIPPQEDYYSFEGSVNQDDSRINEAWGRTCS